MLKHTPKILSTLFFLFFLFLPSTTLAVGPGGRCNDDTECDRPLICEPYAGAKSCSGADCSETDPCPSGRTCLMSEATPRCSRSDDEIPACTTDRDCAGNPYRRFFCVDGECVVCRTNENCPSEQVCDAGVCRRVSEIPPCPLSRPADDCRACNTDGDCSGVPGTICTVNASGRGTDCLRRRCSQGEIVGNPTYCPGGRTCSTTSLGNFCEPKSDAPYYFPETVRAPAAGQSCDEMAECIEYGLVCKGIPPTCQPCSEGECPSGMPCINYRCGAAGFEAATYCEPDQPPGADGCPTGQRCHRRSRTCQAPNYCWDDVDCPPDTSEFEYKCENYECKTYTLSPPPPPLPPAVPYVYEITPPELKIPLPTLAGLTKFLPATLVGETGDRYLIIPWIAEYIAAIYKYAIGVTGILAGIMIVIGGLIWLTAGGAAERISAAKSFIETALIGLAIALTSYLLLYAINPQLVEFRSLKVKFIERVGEAPVVINITNGQVTTRRETEETAQAEVAQEEIAPDAESCTILFLTDSQGHPQCFKGVVDAMLTEQNVNIVIHGGDVADAPDQWQSWWDTPSEPLRAKWPIYAVTGNHDLEAGVSKFAERFTSSFPLPKKITCGNTDFFLLPFPGTNKNWLADHIPKSTAKWQVIVTHRPMYYSCTASGSITGKNLVPLEAIEGVDLILSGHEHVYCDGEKDGRRYIIGNTAGSKFRRCREPKLSQCNDEMKQSYLRIEFGSSINVQRKTIDQPAGCRTYYAGS